MEAWEAKVVALGNAKLVLADAALVAEFKTLKGEELSGGAIKKILKYAAQVLPSLDIWRNIESIGPLGWQKGEEG